MNFDPSLNYGTLRAQDLQKIKGKEKELEQTGQGEQSAGQTTAAPKQVQVEASALEVIAGQNIVFQQLKTDKPHSPEGAIGPNGINNVHSLLETLIDRWYTENETLSYDEKIDLLTQIIDHLNQNSDTFEADNRKWQMIRHTVYLQNGYEYFQGIQDDPEFDPQTFNWDSVNWQFCDYIFPGGSTINELWANGDQYGWPSDYIIFSIGENLIYNYHEQVIFYEYNVALYQSIISRLELYVQMPGINNAELTSTQQLIEQYNEILANNQMHLDDIRIGSEYEDRVADWEANNLNMSNSEKLLLVNEILNLLSQMIPSEPVEAAIVHWTEIRGSLSAIHQQNEAKNSL